MNYSRNPEPGQEPSIKKWQEIKPTAPEDFRALDVMIARRLGWHIDAEITPRGEIFYALVSPDGTIIEDTMVAKSECIGENDAEKIADAAGTIWAYFADDDDPIPDAPLPHYSTDTNALLSILREWPDDAVDLHDGSLDYYGLAGVMELLIAGEYVKLCKAWLVWKDARSPRGDSEGGV